LQHIHTREASIHKSNKKNSPTTTRRKNCSKDVHQTRTSDADDEDDDEEEFTKLHRKQYLLATKENVTH
jgi:hypothetical protein